MRRGQPRRNIYDPGKQAPDRRVAERDIPLHARVAVVEVEDAYGLSEGATAQRAQRADGSLAPEHATEWRSPGSPKVQVVKNVKDPLAYLYAKGHIDEVQYKAGRKWQELYERAELGSVQSVDTTKEPVDGGRWPELITDAQRKAIAELGRVSAVLGAVLDKLVRDILGARMTISKAALARGDNRQRRIEGWGFMFGRALDMLAQMFGLTTAERKP